MVKRLIGLVIAIAVIGAIVAVQYMGDSDLLKEVEKPDDIVVKGYVGGEKMAFFANPEVIALLDKKYGITIDAHKKGSVVMAKDTSLHTGIDFLWPSNFVCVEWFTQAGGHSKGADVVFNSPIVIYTPDKVADFLVQQGIAKRINKAYYIVDFPRLVQLAIDGTKWNEIGLSEINGTVKIFSTDPHYSNSGNIFYGLLANILNNSEVVSQNTIATILPQVKSYYERMGFQQKSSGDVFDVFISNRYTNPLLVGYENQLIEYAINNSDDYTIKFLKEKIRTLYPQPTVWSSHPMIALNDNGLRLMEALKDQQIQTIAWEQHGFRSSVKGVPNDPNRHQVSGLPEEITSIIQMPSAATMDMILAALAK
jgi:hypothetical protein